MTTIIAGNWKMNYGITETKGFMEGLDPQLNVGEDVIAAVMPPFISLETANRVKPAWLSLGAQNMFYEENGAYTGEISPNMLADLGIRYVIIGHSERRGIFRETDEEVAKKAKGAVNNRLTPIICVGETLAERDNGIAEQVVTDQVTESIKYLGKEDIGEVVFAYEPVWAIGTGRAATPDDVDQVTSKMKEQLRKAGNHDIPILYGGSVKPDNMEEFLQLTSINGALVGGKSLEPDTFMELIDIAERMS